jgi:hypothetical protein
MGPPILGMAVSLVLDHFGMSFWESTVVGLLTTCGILLLAFPADELFGRSTDRHQGTP